MQVLILQTINVPGIPDDPNNSYISFTLSSDMNSGGPYYWRVRGQFGEIKSEWCIGPDFYITKLDTVEPIYPCGGVTLNTGSPRFYWNKLVDKSNVNYEIEVCLENDGCVNFANNVKTISVVDLDETFFNYSLGQGKGKWRIRASQQVDASQVCYGDWSDVCEFELDSICDAVITAGQCDPNVTCNKIIEFKWDAPCANDISGYNFEYSTVAPVNGIYDENFLYYNLYPKETKSITLDETPLGMKSGSMIPLVNGTYYVTVRTVSGNGPNASFGNPQDCVIVVGGLMNNPTGLTSTPNPTCSKNPTFTWTETSDPPGPDYYRIQITDKDPGSVIGAWTNEANLIGNRDIFDASGSVGANGVMDSFITEDATGTPDDSTTFTVPTGYELQGGGTTGKDYWVRVQGEFGDPNGVHCPSGWSNEFKINIRDLGGKPTLQTPPNGTIDCDQMPTFTWDSLSTATYYKIEIATDASVNGTGAFVNPIYSNSSISGTSYTLPYDNRLANGIYYWHVAGGNATCLGDYSDMFIYEVRIISGVVSGTIPTLYCAGSIPTFTWDVSGITTYTPAKNLKFNVIIDSDNNTANGAQGGVAASPTYDSSVTTYTPSTAIPNGTWYWYVRVYNEATCTVMPNPPTNATEKNNIAISDCCEIFYTTPQKFEFGDIGSFTLNTPSGDVCGPTNPTFSWSSATGATKYIIQINNSSTFPDAPPTPSTATYEGIVDDDASGLDQTFTPTTSDETTTPGVYFPDPIPNGTWFWRVRPINASCNGDWSTAKQIFIDVMGIPTITSPTDKCDNKPVFTWTTVANALRYDIEIQTGTDWAAPTGYIPLNNIGNGTTTTYTYPGAPVLGNGTYYWRLRADSANSSCSGEWTVHDTFTINQITGTPTLVNPSGEVCGPTNPSFEWNGVTGATGYVFQLHTSLPMPDAPSFPSTAEYETILNSTSTTFTPTSTTATTTPAKFFPDPIPNGTWYWRVRAKNADCYSPWSTEKQIHIDVPEVPTPTNPSNPCTSEPVFTWTGVSNADNFTIEIQTGTDWSAPTGYIPCNNIGTGASTSFNYTTPSYPALGNGTYYWRMRANSSNSSCSSVWTATGSFTVNKVNDIPGLVRPIPPENTVCTDTADFWFNISDVTIDTYGIDLEWDDAGTWVEVECPLNHTCQSGGSTSASPNATEIVDVSAGDDYEPDPSNPTTGRVEYLSKIELKPGATYRWRVRSERGVCKSDYSPWETFIVDTLIPPTVITPNAETVCTYTFDEGVNPGDPYYYRFVWEKVPTATEYDVQVSLNTTAGFQLVISDIPADASADPNQELSLENNQYLVPNTTIAWPGNGNYYWRVRANRASSCSVGGVWSAWIPFEINNVQNEPPVGMSDADKETFLHDPASRKVALTNPANGTTECDNIIELYWGTITGGDKYRVQISTDTTDWAGTEVAMLGDTNAGDPAITGTTTTWGCGTISCSGRYYWRVIPYNDDCEGIWSNYRSFDFDIFDPITLSGPATNTKLCNSGGDPDLDDTPKVEWNTTASIVGNTMQYELQFTANTGSSPYNYTHNPALMTDTTYTVPAGSPLPPSEHGVTQWRVRAYDGHCYSPWTSYWNLVNRTPYEHATQFDSWTCSESGRNHWCNSNDDVTFSWDNNSKWPNGHPVYNAELWDIEFYLHDGSYGPPALPGTPIWTKTGLNDPDTTQAAWDSFKSYISSNPPNPLTSDNADDNTYYWRVHGYNSDCDMNDWSPLQKVIIEEVEKPDLVFPIGNEYVCFPDNPILDWDIVNVAPEVSPAKYRFQVERLENDVTKYCDCNSASCWNCNSSSCRDWCQRWDKTITNGDTEIELPVGNANTIGSFYTSVRYSSGGIDYKLAGQYRWKMKAYSGAETCCDSGYTNWTYFRIFNKEAPPTNAWNAGYFGCNYQRPCGVSNCWQYPWKFRGDDHVQTVTWYAPPNTNAFQIIVTDEFDNIVRGGAGNEIYIPADTNWDNSGAAGQPDYPSALANMSNFQQFEFDLVDSPGGELLCGTYKLKVRATLFEDPSNWENAIVPTSGHFDYGVAPDPSDTWWSGCWTIWSAPQTFYVLKADDPTRYQIILKDAEKDTMTVNGREMLTCDASGNVLEWLDARCDIGTVPIDHAGFTKYHLQIDKATNSNGTLNFNGHFDGDGTHDYYSTNLNINTPVLTYTMTPPFANDCGVYRVRIRQEDGEIGNCYACQDCNDSYAPWSTLHEDLYVVDQHLFPTSINYNVVNGDAYKGNDNLVCKFYAKHSNKWNGLVCSTLQPGFRWNAVCSANMYFVQVDDDPAFGSPVFTKTTNLTEISPEGVGYSQVLNNNTVYYWRVRPHNTTTGCTADWNDTSLVPVWNFETRYIANAQPAILNPTYNVKSINCSETVVHMEWIDVVGENGYVVELDDQAAFFQAYTMLRPENSTTCDFTIPTDFLSKNVLYWRVAPYVLCKDTYDKDDTSNLCWGELSDYLTPLSGASQLILVNQLRNKPYNPPAVNNLENCDETWDKDCDDPSDNVHLNLQPLTIDWNPVDYVADTNGTDYEWEVYSAADLTDIFNPVFDVADLAASGTIAGDASPLEIPNSDLSALAECTTYWFRVRVSDACDNNIWSEVIPFKIANAGGTCP